MDPEYFQTCQVTLKNDVYSYGIVLVEILTGLKPICEESYRGEMSLYGLFLSKLKDKNIKKIIHKKLLEEGNMQQIEGMAKITRKCLHFERKKRPLVKEVAEELIRVRGRRRTTRFNDEDDGVFD